MYFQSHYGAIATMRASSPHPTSPQLSIPLWCDCNMWLCDYVFMRSTIFQSHYGAIATALTSMSGTSSTNFQSHYGAIATCLPVNNTSWRWWLSIPLWCDCKSTWILQVRIEAVSIPLWCDCKCKVWVNDLRRRKRFNPTMVRLQGRRYPSCVRGNQCFNPTMVRLQGNLR